MAVTLVSNIWDLSHMPIVIETKLLYADIIIMYSYGVAAPCQSYCPQLYVLSVFLCVASFPAYFLCFCPFQ